MSGNSIGKSFTVTTFGESHGKALGCIIDGCPPGIIISEQDIQVELDKRRPGSNAFTTQRSEKDKVQILSGIFEGKTTGTPIGMIIFNEDQKSEDYDNLKDVFRPSHADYTYLKKYGLRDHRGSGRASARETVMRVAAGAIAKKYLKDHLAVEITGYVEQVGEIIADQIDLKEINNNAFFFPDKTKLKSLEDLIASLREAGDSVGAKIKINVNNVPAGLGEPVFDKLDADLAHGLMSINAVKGVELGLGFDVVSKKGSEHRDEIDRDGFASNNAGGILGGISSGQPIDIAIALKPTSSISTAGKTVDKSGKETTVQSIGRHDPCVGLRAVPIAESMVAIILLDHYLRNRAQNNDVENSSYTIPTSE